MIFLDLYTALLAPALCRVCSQGGHWWCLSGKPVPWPRCLSCRHSFHADRAQNGCAGGPPLIALGSYDDPPLRRLLHEWKYEGYWAMSSDWARVLAQTVRYWTFSEVSLVPVPCHRRRRLARGFNQAEVLARQIGRLLDLPVLPVARKMRFHEPQAHVPLDDRHANIAGTFSVPISGEGRKILVVDDVVTTGATIAALMHELERAHYQVAGVLSVADAGRR